jgi:hypothetical protein
VPELIRADQFEVRLELHANEIRVLSEPIREAPSHRRVRVHEIAEARSNHGAVLPEAESRRLKPGLHLDLEFVEGVRVNLRHDHSFREAPENTGIR